MIQKKKEIKNERRRFPTMRKEKKERTNALHGGKKERKN